MKKCLFLQCGTILNEYNKSKFCLRHNRLLIQNDLCYEGGNFFEIRLTRGKSKRISFGKNRLNSLKEIARVEDYCLNEEKNLYENQLKVMPTAKLYAHYK